jgi:LCP family protein required for cell wall assembly
MTTPNSENPRPIPEEADEIPQTPDLDVTQPAQALPTQPVVPVSPPSGEPASPGLPTPVVPARTRRRGGCLWLLSLLAVIAVIPVFLAGVGMVIYLVFPPQPLDIIVMGMDSRPGEGFEARTDSFMILGVDPANLQVSLLSIPRDIFIETPGYGLWRINTINRDAELSEPGSGPALVKAAIANSFPIEPDRYVRINFEGFTNIVDALGGIDVEVPNLLIDNLYPDGEDGTITVEFQPGWQHMDGARALMYARTRHADDDYQRAARQQQVLAGIFRAMLNPLNWPRLPGVIQAFSSAVDTDLTILDLWTITPPLLFDGAAGEMDRLVIDRSLILLTPNGNAVPNYTLLNPWIDEHFH